MKVKELIDELSKQNPDVDVIMSCTTADGNILHGIASSVRKPISWKDVIFIDGEEVFDVII